MKRILYLFKNTGLRTRLIVAYIALITIPLGIFGFRYYTVSKNVVSEIAQKNVYELVKKNNQIIDTKLLQATEKILSFTVDRDLYNSFATIKPTDDYNVNLLDSRITAVMNKYFSHSEDIYSAQLATSYFTFGSTSSLTSQNNKNFIPAGEFTRTQLYQQALKSDGKLSWVPTYEFATMFKLDYMKYVNVDYRYMFSAVQLSKGSYLDSIYKPWDKDMEKPVLIVNFKEDFFQNAFRNSIPFPDSYFLVVSQEGRVISHQNQKELGKQSSSPWLREIIAKRSGSGIVNIGGQDRIVCYDTSNVTGWVSVVVIPPASLLGKILAAMKSYIILMAVILIVVSIFISSFVTGRITRPLQKLLTAIRKTGEGDFNASIADQGSGEVRVLIQKFNDMNGKIQKLIEENYEIAIKEQEAVITALNLQLDPHFMYNTLNLINLIAVEKGEDEISEMIVSLSAMLKYTVKSNSDLVPFQKDFEYLKSYIFIMSKRFEGRFQVEYDIDPKLFASGVPKFFMQPFVENVFVHAFHSSEHKGMLKISCWIDGHSRFFTIEDNGKGMDSQRMETLLQEGQNSVGMYNIHKRIAMIFGSSYGVRIESEVGKGTKVTIELPKA